MNDNKVSITVRINKEDQRLAEEILGKLGFSMNDLVNMTIKELILRRGIPFKVSLPLEEDELCKYFSKQEFDDCSKELNYMETHLDEYLSYDNIESLRKALLSND